MLIVLISLPILYFFRQIFIYCIYPFLAKTQPEFLELIFVFKTNYHTHFLNHRNLIFYNIKNIIIQLRI